jgi:hypothetical protein
VENVEKRKSKQEDHVGSFRENKIILIDRKAEGGLRVLDQKFSACFVMDWDNNVGILVEGTVRYSERLKALILKLRREEEVNLIQKKTKFSTCYKVRRSVVFIYILTHIPK